MAFVGFLTLCALPFVTHQAVLSEVRATSATELDYELSARRTVMAATGLLHGLESDIARLSQTFDISGGVESLVQIDSELSTKPAAAAANTAASKPTLRKKGIDATTAVKEMAKLKPSQMPAMLGLLTGMIDSWKDKIGEANKKEQEQKKAYEETLKDMEAKKAAANGNKDAMATYDRIENYWKRQRAISHRQYHTALKIMHSGMQKFKSVSSAMGNAIAGKKPSHKDLQTVGMAMPDVVLLQREVHRLVAWTQGAVEDLHGAVHLSA